MGLHTPFSLRISNIPAPPPRRNVDSFQRGPYLFCCRQAMLHFTMKNQAATRKCSHGPLLPLREHPQAIRASYTTPNSLLIRRGFSCLYQNLPFVLLLLRKGLDISFIKTMVSMGFGVLPPPLKRCLCGWKHINGDAPLH